MKGSTQKTHALVRHVLVIAIDRENRYLKSRPPCFACSIWILMFSIVKISTRFLSFGVERPVIVQSRASFLQEGPLFMVSKE